MLLFTLIITCAFSIKHVVPVMETPMIFASYRSLTGMGMFAAEDAPATGPPGNGKTTITASLEFERDRGSDSGMVQLLVIPDKDMSGVGSYFDSQPYFCCTQDLSGKVDGCRETSELNKLIISGQLKAKGFTPEHQTTVQFKPKEFTKAIEWTHTVQKSGLNIFVVAVCDPFVGSVTFEGVTTWMNPYGHLPGEMHGYLPFYGWLSIVFAILFVIWGVVVMISSEIMSIHKHISVVLAICALEMVAWYLDYKSLNTNGARNSITLVCAMLFSVSRRTLIRMVTLAVAQGYSVVKLELDKAVRTRVLILGFVYWIFAFLFEVFIHYHETNEVSPTLRVFLTPPVAILDGIFWWWIFVSLHKTVIELTAQRQSKKLTLYKNFSFILGFALILAFLFACFQLYYIYDELYVKQWPYMWLLEVGFWQVLFLLFTVVLMILWRPSAHSKEYAFHHQVQTDEGTEENATMFSGAPDTMD